MTSTWWLQVPKSFFCPGYKRGLSVHTVGMYFFLLVNFKLAMFNQNGWSHVSKNLFYNSFQKIRWPGRKETPYLLPTAGGVAGWALSFSHREFTPSSHRKHRQGFAKINTWSDNREAWEMHTCRKSSSAPSDTHQSVLGKKFPHYVGNSLSAHHWHSSGLFKSCFSGNSRVLPILGFPPRNSGQGERTSAGVCTVCEVPMW